MKNIKLLTIVLSVIVFASCSTDYADNDFSTDTDSGWIQFPSDSLSAAGSQTLSIPLQLNTVTNSSSLDVTYTVEAVEGNVPQSVIGTFTQSNAVNVDRLTGGINFEAAAAPEGECYTVKVTINSTNRENVIVGLEGNHPIEQIVQVGNISATYSGVTNFQGSAVENFTANLTPIEGRPGSYEIDTAWGPGLVGGLTGDPSLMAPYDGILTINPDGSVTIDGNEAYATGGSGSFNPCLGTITYTLTQAFFTNADLLFEVTLTQN